MKILQDAIEAFYSKAKNDKYPKCFNSVKEYECWTAHENIAHTEPRLFPCRDCTTEYQSEMVGTARCYIPMIAVRRIAK